MHRLEWYSRNCTIVIEILIALMRVAVIFNNPVHSCCINVSTVGWT